MHIRWSLIIFVITNALLFGVGSCELRWLRNRRQISSSGKVAPTEKSNSQQKPCPESCTCNYNIINCNTLIDSCRECLQWREIDFNQITHIHKRAFRNFHFAPNHTSNIIIYKLLNSSIGADTFDSFRVPENGQVEVTFQYNSVIKFEPYVLRGLRIEKNATMIFNFPYTTQVVFAPRCFEGVQMLSNSSRLIIRILKSFSVRFLSDFNYYLKSSYFQQHQQQANANNNNKIKTTSNNSNNKSPLAVYLDQQQQQPSSSSKSWSVERGTLIIDIKSTHLVKFEEFSLASMELKSGARFYLDLELVEKLMFHRYSFADFEFFGPSRAVLFAKQITFIDFRAFSFAGLVLHEAAQLEVYLEELTSSLCLQRNVFSNMRVHRAASFNFSVISSKNVQLMHDSFSNLTFDGANSRVHIGVYNMPSYLLLFHNQNYYGRFMGERLSYLWQSNNFNAYTGHHNHFYNSAPYIITSNNDLYYNRFVGDKTMAAAMTASHEDKIHQKDRFYQLNKQIYSYNFSIEKNFFNDLNSANHHYHQNQHVSQVSIVADNLHTLLIDDFLVNYSATSMSMMSKSVDFSFVINVKNFVLSPNALGYVYNVMAEFVREPQRVKLGLPKIDNNLVVFGSGTSKRTIRLIGLSLVDDNNSQFASPGDSIRSNITSTASADSFNDYYDDQDPIKQYDKYKSSNTLTTQISTKIDGVCNLSSLPQSDTRIILVLKHDQPQQQCSCNMIHLLSNQLANSNDRSALLNQLSCQMPSDRELFISSCMRKLHSRCIAGNNETDRRVFLRGFVRFWEYCINEVDPPMIRYVKSETGDLLPQNDGFFSQSSSASWPFYDDVQPSSSSFDDDQIFPFKAEFDSSSNGRSSLDQQKWSNADGGEAASGDGYDNSASSNGLFKIVGIAICCIVLAIVLFMITVNIIQYKFRDDLYDDYEFNSTNSKANNGNSPTVDNESLSSSSRTSSRPSKDAKQSESLLNTNETQSDTKTSSSRKTLSSSLQNSHFSPVEEVDEEDEDDEEIDEDESDTNSKNYYNPKANNEDEGYLVINNDQCQDYFEDDEDEEENEERIRPRRGDDERLKKNDSADSSGIASNSNSDQTIVIVPSPVIATKKTTNKGVKKTTRFAEPIY